MVGRFGTLLGQKGINIAAMSVGRHTRRGQAVVILSLDEPVNKSIADEIKASASIDDVYPVTLQAVAE